MTISELVKRENNNFDLIRILLAICVIISHAQVINGSNVPDFDPIHLALKYAKIGSTAVYMFFFISGLVVVNSLIQKKDLLYFVISRLFRLVPALFLVVFITAFLVGPLVTKFSAYEYFQSKLTYNYVLKNTIFFNSILFAWCI